VKRARFLAVARLEYLAEVAYYSEAEVDLGARFAEAVEEATSRALGFPLAGSPASAGTRRVLLRDFPFSLVYLTEESGIVVVALAPDARRPGYWRSRLRAR